MPGACFQGSRVGVAGAASASGEGGVAEEGRRAGGASTMISRLELANLIPGRDSRAQCLRYAQRRSTERRKRGVPSSCVSLESSVANSKRFDGRRERTGGRTCSERCESFCYSSDSLGGSEGCVHRRSRAGGGEKGRRATASSSSPSAHLLRALGCRSLPVNTLSHA